MRPHKLLAAETAQADLEDRLGNAFFESEDLAREIKDKIAANQEEQNDLRIAIAAAERKHEEALKAERSAAIDRTRNDVRLLQKKLRDQYVRLHEHLSPACELINSILADEQKIIAANAEFKSLGIKDEYLLPLSMLSASLGTIVTRTSTHRVSGSMDIFHGTLKVPPSHI